VIIGATPEGKKAGLPCHGVCAMARTRIGTTIRFVSWLFSGCFNDKARSHPL
jgi:hypothetical protein